MDSESLVCRDSFSSAIALSFWLMIFMFSVSSLVFTAARRRDSMRETWFWSSWFFFSAFAFSLSSLSALNLRFLSSLSRDLRAAVAVLKRFVKSIARLSAFSSRSESFAMDVLSLFGTDLFLGAGSPLCSSWVTASLSFSSRRTIFSC